jgi:hypothetical protein
MIKDLSRRHFLSGAAASGLSAALPDLGAVSLNADLYTNKCLRISLSKPPYWQFVSVKAFNANLDDMEERLSRPEMLRAIREVNEDDPILVICKRSPRSKGIVPTIQLMTDPVSHEPAEFLDKAKLGASLGASFYEDYSLERPFEVRRIEGQDFGYFVSTFRQTLDEESIDCRMHCAVVITDLAEFTLGSIAPIRGQDECTREFVEVLASLRFLPAA